MNIKLPAGDIKYIWPMWPFPNVTDRFIIERWETKDAEKFDYKEGDVIPVTATDDVNEDGSEIVRYLHIVTVGNAFLTSEVGNGRHAVYEKRIYVKLKRTP